MKKILLPFLVVASLAAGAAEGFSASSNLFDNGGFFVGCNYWARHAGMYMWSDWRPDEMRAEIAALAKNGVKVMRVFPLWSEFQPLTGDCRRGGSYRAYRFRDNKPLPNAAGVDDEMIARFRVLCDIAAANDIRLIVGLVTGWMSGRQFVPSVFEEKNVISDSDALMWQARFVKYFVAALKDHPAIAAWDFGNECNCLGAAEAGQAAFYNWMDHLALAIRSQDSTRPIVSGMHGLSTDEKNHSPIRLNGELSDILCTHPYAFYVPGCGLEPFNTMRTALHPTAESLLYRDLGGKPCFVEEIGNLGTACTSEARTAAGVRTTLFSAWAHDLKGLLWWCNSDQEGLLFPPYELTPYERELGLLRQDLTPKPVMREMAAFQAFRASLPFVKLPKARTDAVIVATEKTDGWVAAFGAYLLSRQAGLTPTFAGAERDLPDAPFYIVSSATTEESYSYPAQTRIFEKAAAGATVLVLYTGTSRFTRLHERAGVTIDACTLAPVTRTFTLAAHPNSPLTTTDSTTCRLLKGDATVEGATADGEPIFTSFALGKGRVYLCNAPLDLNAVARADVFTGEKPMPYYLVVAEAAKNVPRSSAVVRGDQPFVALTEHPCADGSTIVIAINFEPRAMTCPIRLNGSLGRIWRGEVTSGSITLPPNEAAVFEVR